MKYTFLKSSLLISIFICQTVTLFAQQLSPIRLHNQPQQQTTTVNARTQGGVRFVTLPFFDDFANQLGSPDTSKWEANQGVYINNTFGIDAHTVGVATFDGLQESGEPYSLDALGLTGQADQLTSHCFDLSGESLADSFQLTFYWQAQGFGELPNEEDFFKLEFRDSLDNWVIQWQVNGDSLTDFNFQQINIEDGRFLHDNFQFRFVNFGRLSGGYDTWNLDYLYFNKKADRFVSILSDMAFIGFAPNRTTTYTSVPAQHLLDNIDSVWADTLIVGVRSAFASDNQLRDVSVNTTVHAPTQVSDIRIKSGSAFLGPLASAEFGFSNDKSLISSLNADSITIVDTYILDLLSGAGDGPLVRANDTLQITSIFSDYYAYDDGSAELGYGVNERFGKIAYQFETLQDDTLRYIDMFLAQLGGQASGSFKLKIWESIDTSATSDSDVELLSTTSFPILYTDGINEFQRLELDEYVPISKGVFYIGLEQLSDQNIMIGFDKNTDSGDKIFYNLGNKWFQNKQFKGSLMLRPVFEFPSTVVSLEEDLARLKETVIYPNPTQHHVWIKGEVEQVALYDITGQLILQKELQRLPEQKIDLPSLNAGIYILKLQKGDAVTSQKLLIAE